MAENQAPSRFRELEPLHAKPSYWDDIEREIARALRKHLYLPLAKVLGLSRREILENTREDLLEAIRSGRITFWQGRFTGQLDAASSRELKRLGAVWDRRARGWAIPLSQLSDDIRLAIAASEDRMRRMAERIDRKLAQVAPKEIAGSLRLENLFDTTVYRINKDFEATVKSLTLQVRLSPEERAAIASKYTHSVKLHIQEWARAEIVDLREKIQANVFSSGNRREAMIDTIRRSYGVSQRKAKFLARQETNLLTSTFKEARYKSVGIKRYRWKCVVGSPEHPVRPMHKMHDGHIFSWDNPPVVDEYGHRKHPQQDYNCLPGSTPVGQLNDIRVLYRRVYPGPLAFAVTSSGTRIEATPNHPVLTLAGWKRLKCVQIGDHLIQTPDQCLHTGEIDEHYAMPTIEQIFGLGRMLGQLPIREGRATEFHGDGSADEVDVVSVESDLPAELSSLQAQAISERVLAVADQVLVGLPLAAQRDLASVAERMLLPPHSAMGRVGQLLSLLSGQSGHTDQARLGAASHAYAMLDQDSPDCRPAHRVLAGKRQLAHPRQVLGNDLLLGNIFSVMCRASDRMAGIQAPSAEVLAQVVRGAPEDSGDLGKMVPFLEKPDRVIDVGISEKPFRHFVYNLENLSNWYVARGLVIHNCRCMAIPIVEF